MAVSGDLQLTGRFSHNGFQLCGASSYLSGDGRDEDRLPGIHSILHCHLL